jgi:YtxH-like protein
MFANCQNGKKGYTNMRLGLRLLPDTQSGSAAILCADPKRSRKPQEKVMIRRNNGWAQVVSAFAIGLGAGAALGVLFAPQSGEDTRGYLSDTAQDGVDEAVGRGKTVIRRVRKNIADAKDFVNDVADTAESAFRDARGASS